MVDRRSLALLALLALGAVRGQGADDVAADSTGDAPAEEECVECEEAWEYVEFLKVEVNEKVTQMLQDFKLSGGAEQAVSQTMTKVMEVREAILGRIKDIRKEVVTICREQNIKQEEKLSEFRMEVMSILLNLVDSNAKDKLKEISDQLLKFRGTIGSEVMRLLMLPQPTCGEKKKVVGDCTECQVLTDLEGTLTVLRDCASKKEDPAEDATAPVDDAPAPDAPAGGDDAEAGAECVEPIMYSMTLILANEELDKAIAELYNTIVQATEEDKRKAAFEQLTTLKGFREKIDEVITKLLDLDDDAEKLKKEVSRSLRLLILEVSTKLEECNAQCGGGGACKSCAGKILTEAIEKMMDYTVILASDSEEDEKKDNIRGDLITHINTINEDSRNIVTIKVESDSGVLEQCDEDKLEVYNRIKGPMWMLVNSTIFSNLDDVTTMVTTMEDLLKVIYSEYCASTDFPGPPPEDNDEDNCGWEEYEKTKEYLVEIDNTIQEGLFKVKDETAKTTVLLAFVKIQGMFDNRVKKLFEDQVKCPEELTTIKKDYMPQLSKCMIEFMSRKVKFLELNRSQRISCIKGLRNSMEDRTAKLLQDELEKSLSGIQQSGN